MALLKNLTRQLFEHGYIFTTETRAKEVRRMAEKLITRGKQDTVHARRIARKTVATNVVGGEDYVRRLFNDIAPQFRDRPGGYTRITKIGFRRGDAAPLVKIELALD